MTLFLFFHVLTSLLDVKCSCVVHPPEHASWRLCVLLPMGYFPHASAVVTVGVLVEVCVLPDAEAEQLLILIRFGSSWSCFCQRRAEGWALCWQEERTTKDRFPAEKSNALDFQRDVDISSFEPLDQAQPFLSLTFHLKSRPQERNDGRLLNI